MTDFPNTLDRASVVFDASFYGAIPDAYYTDGTTKGAFTVTNISTAEVITVSATHNYEVGDYVSFSGTTSTPSLGSTPIYNVTAITGTTITIGGVDITVGGASGGTIRNHTLRSATANFSAGDVGKNVVALRTGPSSGQDTHTTISAYVSATQVTLTDRPQVARTSARIYVSRNGAQTTAIQNAVNAAGLAGGGIVLLTGVGYLVDNTITLKARVTIQGGRGTKRGTMLHLAGSINKPVITNDQTAQNYAQFCSVRDLWVDGNRLRNTTDFTTTLNGAYTAGATTITLTTTTGLQSAGSLIIVDATTKAITNAVASGTLIRITATAHGFTTGDMVTIASVGGVSAATGRWTITVIDANTFDLVGSTFSGSYTSGGTAAWTVIVFYEGVSGSTVTTAAGGREGSVDHSLATGSTVTQPQNHGILWVANPYNVPGTDTEAFDSWFRVENVLIKNTRGDGYAAWGLSESRLRDVHVELTDNFGFRTSFDHWVSDCTASYAGRAGLFGAYSGLRISNSKCWTCGSNVPQEGHGFFIEGPPTIEEGLKELGVCEAQDNKACGFYFRNAQRVNAVGLTASSNSVSAVGGHPGVRVDGCTNGIIAIACTDRTATATQTNAIELLATTFTPAGMQIIVTHGTTGGGGALSTAVKAGSILTGGVNLLINGMGGKTTVAPAGAGTVTPDPYVASSYRILMPAGNITIAAPANAHEGCPLKITIIQDGTGSRTVTWNAAYKFTGAVSPTLTTTANRRDVFTFEYDATSAIWAEQSRDLNVG